MWVRCWAHIQLRHQPGVEDEAVEARAAAFDVLAHLRRCGPHALEVTQVAVNLHNGTAALWRSLSGGLDLTERGVGVLARPIEEDQVPLTHRDVLRKHEAQPTAASGDRVCLACEVLRQGLPYGLGVLARRLGALWDADDRFGGDARQVEVANRVSPALQHDVCAAVRSFRASP